MIKIVSDFLMIATSMKPVVEVYSYTNNLHLPITEPAYNKHFAPNDPQIQNCAHRDFLAHDYWG